MSAQARPTDEQLREVGGHLLWHAQQLCFLAVHLEERQGGSHVKRFDYPLDAAALEAFLVHARALADFMWLRRKRKSDAIAADYFDPRSEQALKWQPRGAPDWYARVRDVIGYGMAHVSYTRLELDARWAWQHRVIAHELVAELERFAREVPKARVDDGWASRLREHIAPVMTHLPRAPGAVGREPAGSGVFVDDGEINRIVWLAHGRTPRSTSGSACT